MIRFAATLVLAACLSSHPAHGILEDTKPPVEPGRGPSSDPQNVPADALKALKGGGDAAILTKMLADPKLDASNIGRLTEGKNTFDAAVRGLDQEIKDLSGQIARIEEANRINAGIETADAPGTHLGAQLPLEEIRTTLGGLQTQRVDYARMSSILGGTIARFQIAALPAAPPAAASGGAPPVLSLGTASGPQPLSAAAVTDRAVGYNAPRMLSRDGNPVALESLQLGDDITIADGSGGTRVLRINAIAGTQNFFQGRDLGTGDVLTLSRGGVEAYASANRADAGVFTGPNRNRELFGVSVFNGGFRRFLDRQNQLVVSGTPVQVPASIFPAATTAIPVTVGSQLSGFRLINTRSGMELVPVYQ